MQRLVATVREEDTVARLGGDEFIIALWHVTGTEDAGRVATKMIEAISQPHNIEGHIVHLTTSVGVRIYPVHGEDEDTLLKSADRALYAAKHAGKNAYAFLIEPLLPQPRKMPRKHLYLPPYPMSLPHMGLRSEVFPAMVPIMGLDPLNY